MTRFRRTFCLLQLAALAALPLVAQAPPEVVRDVASEVASNSQVMAHLDHLTNDIGPRLTGSERLTRACEWARDRFASFGLENARLEQWGTIDVGFDRGAHSGFLEAGGKRRPVTFGSHAWTPGTAGLVEGPVVLAPESEDELDDLAARAKGAWVLRRRGSASRRDLERVCEDAGACGVISRVGELIHTGGNHRLTWGSLPTLVRINLLGADFDEVVERLEAGEDVRLAFDVQNHFKKGPIPLYNVIADIPGNEKPDEFVIVGGHIDSWDGATGTTDNGTGVATTIEAARLLMAAGAKPRRTIRFMLWSGEEQGLLGSVAYIGKHPDELEKISAVLVHDGGTNYVSGIQATPDMRPAMEAAFKPVIDLIAARNQGSSTGGSPIESRPAETALAFAIAPVRGLPRGIGSDHDAFLARGVPGFFWRQAGRANYNRTHHTQHDTFDAAIPEYQRHSSLVIALGALGIANLDAMIPRSKDMIQPPNIATNRRRLGVNLAGDDDTDLTIGGIREGSHAERIGLRVGDRILKVDGAPVNNVDELSGALNTGAPKKTLVIRREGAERTMIVEFGPAESRPRD